MSEISAGCAAVKEIGGAGAFSPLLRQRAGWREGVTQWKSLAGLLYAGLAPIRQDFRITRAIVPLNATNGSAGEISRMTINVAGNGYCL